MTEVYKLPAPTDLSDNPKEAYREVLKVVKAANIEIYDSSWSFDSEGYVLTITLTITGQEQKQVLSVAPWDFIESVPDGRIFIWSAANASGYEAAQDLLDYEQTPENLDD